jgi:hypothetical protein
LEEAMSKTIAVANTVAAALVAGAGLLCAYPDAQGISQPASCDLQGWPNYAMSCVRDSRQPNGAARQVRVVPIDRPSAVFVSYLSR